MKNVRISKHTEPSKAASSILYFLEAGDNVEVSALGSSAGTLIKAVGLVSNLSSLDLSYHPRIEYIKDDRGTSRSAVMMTILLK